MAGDVEAWLLAGPLLRGRRTTDAVGLLSCLREYVCLFVIPVQWCTAALCRSYDDACSTVLVICFPVSS